MQTDLFGWVLFKLMMAVAIAAYAVRFLAGLLVRALEGGPDGIG